MKTFIIFCSLVALTLGEIVASNKYDLHHSQHEQSVSAARQKLQENLSKLESQSGSSHGTAQYGNSYGSSGSQKYVAGCSTCYGGSENRASFTSRQSSSSSSQQRTAQGVVDSDYNGVGFVGHSNDARFTVNGDDDVQSLVGAGSGSSLSSRYSSHNAHESEDTQQRVAPSYVGSSSGISSRYSSQNAHEADSLQQRVAPSYVGSGSSISRYSSHNANEVEDLQHRVVPTDLSTIQSSAYRSKGSEYEEEDLQKTVSPTTKPFYGGSRYHQKSRDESNSEGRTSSTYASEGSQGQHRESGSGQVINIAVRPGTSTVLAVPVRVIQTQGVADDQQNHYSRNSEYQSGSESSSNTRSQYPASTTYRVVYTPSRNSVSSDKISSTYQSENSRTVGGVQQTEKLVNYNSYSPESSSHSRFNAEESNQVRVAPVSVSYPSNGGSSRVAYGSSQGNLAHTRVPIAPINTVETVSSSKTAEERDERRYTPSNPTYISANRNSESAYGESRNQVSSSTRPSYVASDRLNSGTSYQGASQHGTSGTTYYVPSRSQSQTNQQSSGSGLQTQYQRQGGFSSTPVGSRTSNTHSTDYLSQRFGTGISNLNTDNLHAYMSESERLARLQQHQIAGSASGSSLSNSELNRQTYQKASNLDSAAAGFVRNSNVGSRLGEFDTVNADGTVAGGYNRVRSWNKQSKWSSGSEYGSDGKPKTYSTLSTAEAEKYNINGAEAGYKAATTTLENDGKVSTYSIHT